MLFCFNGNGHETDGFFSQGKLYITLINANSYLAFFKAIFLESKQSVSLWPGASQEAGERFKRCLSNTIWHGALLPYQLSQRPWWTESEGGSEKRHEVYREAISRGRQSTIHSSGKGSLCHQRLVFFNYWCFLGETEPALTSSKHWLLVLLWLFTFTQSPWQPVRLSVVCCCSADASTHSQRHSALSMCERPPLSRWGPPSITLSLAIIPLGRKPALTNCSDVVFSPPMSRHILADSSCCQH